MTENTEGVRCVKDARKPIVNIDGGAIPTVILPDKELILVHCGNSAD